MDFRIGSLPHHSGILFGDNPTSMPTFHDNILLWW
ncbi:hypothetical protein DL240490_03804 [Mycobacterium marinum]|nr:hypothetical protein DL240490_03804 [Mycobacterium marinum]